MTRLANIEKAGYFPLPAAVTDLILSYIAHIAAPDGGSFGRILDPCAGKGAALVTLAERLNLEPFGVATLKEHEGSLADGVAWGRKILPEGDIEGYPNKPYWNPPPGNGYGFFFAAYNSRGSLHWAYNWGRGFDTTEGNNWMYAWHTPFDTIPSPTYEGIREAWDDRRVIETYKKRFMGEREPMALLHEILRQAAASRTRGGRDTVSDFWTAVDDVGKLDRWRNALLERLVKDK